MSYHKAEQFMLPLPEKEETMRKRTKLEHRLLMALSFTLGQAEEMGCNCGTAEQVNKGHNIDCPANQYNETFKEVRRTILQATKDTSL